VGRASVPAKSREGTPAPLYFVMIFLLQQITPPEDINFGALFLRMIVFLGLVVLLIVLFLKKVLPLLLPGSHQRTRSIRILERVAIDQRKSLLVVEIQEKIYLLGSAEGQINVLMELDPAKVMVPEPAIPKSISFSDVLKKTFSKEKSS
jgi:flagellar biosynthetic protein FliO